MISLELSNEQKGFERKFRRLAKEKIHPVSLKIDAGKPGPIDNAYLEILSGENLNAFIIPKEYGGHPPDFLTLSLIIEEIGYGCAGLASIYASSMQAVSALLIGGSHEQKEAFLPLLLNPGNGVAGCCITEEKGGSDTSSFTTKARPDGDHYIISGSKSPIINAGNAAFYIVWASSDTDRGRAGMNAFIVPRDTPGLIFSAYHDKPGLRCAPTATVFFNDVAVPKSNLIGLPGSGYLLLMQTLDWGRAFFAAICVGLTRAAQDETINFAKKRIILNRPLIKNQGISFILAEQATNICASRLLVWKAFRLMDLNMDYTRESSMAKLSASELAVRVTTEGMLILGQSGYTQPSLMAKFQRDAQALRILEGTSQIQKKIIASQF
jgi:alkylation response protein AidB-like acyl-CoA dehydrogenase